MSSTPSTPILLRRLAALSAIALALLVVALLVIRVVDRPLFLLTELALLAAAAVAVWYGISRIGPERWAAVVVAIGALIGVVAMVLSAPGWPLLIDGALLALAFVLGRYALSRNIRTLKARETPGTPVPAAVRGVLIMNLRSGGGKAERFHLADECRARGIEPVVLQQGDDLQQLARDAIDRGADVIGMAGGDGSQALVAGVAAERGIPMVVVPAGTRNHLALDLGIDRGEVVEALDAFDEAVERTIDLADANGRVFVNNVSLGLYATIVRSPEYRDAKVDTTLAALPRVLGPGTEPFDLRFDGPDGERHDGAHLVQVSNNPYGTTVVGLGTRPRLDTGRLGIAALVISDDREARRFLGELATGRLDRFDGFTAWSAPTFEVSSGSPIPIGLDGETMEIDPPLVFSSRPGVLRVRLSKQAIGYSPSALAPGWRSAIPDLWRTALGHPIPIET
jgi:diacylglycerol kinase family enzyme